MEEMEIIDSFRKIFDKAPVKEERDSLDIMEQDPRATFKKLQLCNTGEVFYDIDKLVLQSPSILCKHSSKILQKNCDGVTLTNGRDGDYLILVELKSSFSPENIVKAYKQIICSLMKIHAMLSFCHGYSLKNINLRGIIACKPFKDANQELVIKDSLHMHLQEGTLRSDLVFLVKLYQNHCVKAKAVSMPLFEEDDRNAFHDDFKGKEIEIHLKMADSYSDTEASMDISKMC